LKLNDGSTKLVDHLNPLYWGFTFQNFFKPVRCWLCLDHSAELAHWSFGDNWVRGLLDKQDNKGASLIVARNAEAADILEYMRKENRVKLQAVTPEMIVVQQALVEKSNVAPRLWIWGKTRHMGPELGSSADRPTQPVEILTALIEYLRILLSHKWRSYWVLDISIGFFRLLHLSFRGIHKSWSGFRRLLSTLRIFSLAKDKPLSKSHMHKIMMIGGFGYRDIGDEAMPHADVINFRERLDDLDIVMCSPDPDYTLAFHGERAIPDITNLSCSHKTSFRRKLKVLFFRYVFLAGAVAERLGVHLRLWPTARTVLDELASADLLFNVGGGNLNSVIPTELYKKCTMHLAARILKKPVILSGQTIGPFDRTIDKLWARICLNRVNMITFRDEAISHKRLLEIGVSKPIMLDTADDAMTLPTLSRRESNFLLYSCVPKSWWMQKAALCIAMNFKGSLMLFKGNDRCDSLSNEVKLMARIADQLIEAYDAKIFFLPTDYHRAADDRVLHREIIALMKYVKRAALVENEYDDIRLKGLISIADAAIGVRYHFCVFAASCFVPFLGMASGVYQRTKLKGLADLCELPNCFVSEDLEFTTCEKVWPQVKEFIENRELSVQVLEMKIPMLKERSLIGVENAWKILRAM
jgi:polysaccharide pyruvyl transferase WcaK-like protein